MMQFGGLTLKRCRSGRMLYTGPYIGKCFDLYGEYSGSELVLMRRFLRPGDTVLLGAAADAFGFLLVCHLEGALVLIIPEPESAAEATGAFVVFERRHERTHSTRSSWSVRDRRNREE